MYQVDSKLCIGCAVCVPACPQNAITMMNGQAYINPALCTDCGECADVCPQGAIHQQEVFQPTLVPQQPRTTEVVTTRPSILRAKSETAEALPVVKVTGEVMPETEVEPDIKIKLPSTTQRRLLPILGGALVWAGRELLPEILRIWGARAAQESDTALIGNSVDQITARGRGGRRGGGRGKGRGQGRGLQRRRGWPWHQ